METRPYRDTDQQAVIALWQAVGLVVPWNDPVKDIARKCAIERDLFLVGEQEGKLIASIMGGYEGHRGWVNYLAISPQHQQRGLGRQMMEEIEEKLLARGCPKLNLQVRSSNTEAIAFYQALGYKMDEAVSLGKRLIPDNLGNKG